MSHFFQSSQFRIGLGIILLIKIVGIIGMYAWFTQLQKPYDPSTITEVQFVIPKGQSVQKIAERLQNEKLIKSSFAFRYAVWSNKLDAKIQAGSFKLNPAMSPAEIATKLTTGTDDLWVTIHEGKRVEEVAEYFKDFAEFDSEEFLTLAKADEGFLFPDTYLFPLQTTATTVHAQLRKRFDDVIKENKLDAKIKKNGATLKSVVIMASLLEREAQSAEDMKIVAGILYNRLQNGMPLQVDATMQYAKGYDEIKKTWWAPALSTDKNIDSPYNTYKVTGLPPAPIANPGLKAITAAIEPTSSDYLFYITDNEGKMHYAKDYDEHLKNVNQYLR